MFRGSVTKADVERAVKLGRAEKRSEEIEYIRFGKEHGKIERGTVITRDKIVWGYPHIKRIFRLDTGIKRNIKSDVLYIEEKIDGYNLRIASIGGRIFAFTRGGYLDPFSTEKVREIAGIKRFFEKQSDYVLCGEMVGNTPFTPPTEKFDVKFFVFDIDDGERYLPPLQKYALLKKFAVASVPFLGRFDKSRIGLMKKTAENLNKGSREGMVMKSSDRKDVVKFVTPYADIDDIEKCSYMFFDMPDGFFHQRILRSSYFLDDFALDRGKYAQRLGAAFYSGLTRAIKDISEGKPVEEEFEILVSDEKIFGRIKTHIGKEVEIRLIFKRKERDGIRIRFSKVYRKTTKTIRGFFEGKGITD